MPRRTRRRWTGVAQPQNRRAFRFAWIGRGPGSGPRRVVPSGAAEHGPDHGTDLGSGHAAFRRRRPRCRSRRVRRGHPGRPAREERAVVEEKYWGGVCLNVGCIPSKALLRNAELAHIFANEAKTFGITGEVTFDYGAAFQRSRKVADGRVKGVHFLMKKNNITEFDGRGTFIDAEHPRRWRWPTAAPRTSPSTTAIIATGATTRLLPGHVAVRAGGDVRGADPHAGPAGQRSIIAGAGAIGVEFAYVLHNYGVKVTIVEFLDRMVPLEDEEVSTELAKRYRKLGIDVLTSTRVESIDDRRPRSPSPSPTRRAAAGLRPTRCCRRSASSRASRATGWRSTGVELTERGAIAIDGYCAPTCRTSSRSATSPRS